MMKNHLFSEMTVLDIKSYLANKSSVILPVGIIEQHGYHLPTFTDSIIAEEIAQRVADKLDIIYLPVLYTSYSGGCLPGTINFNPATLMHCLTDICTSLAGQGFRNIFILLGHGGSENLKTIETSLHIMLRENPIFDNVLVAFTPFWRFCDLFLKGFYAGDGHGGNGETSLVKYLRPELVSSTLELDAAEVLEGMKKHPDFYQKHEKPYDRPEVVPRITQKESVQVGVMGDVGAATAEAGRAMVDETVEKLAAFYKQCLTERSPKYRVVQPKLGKLVL